MLYKVTPMMVPAVEGKKSREPGAPRKRRRSAIYDADGSEVLITLMCLKCRQIKPLGQFGLRKMADGAIRNQPWCRGCRSGASAAKEKVANLVDVSPVMEVHAAAIEEGVSEPVQAPELSEEPKTPSMHAISPVVTLP